MASDNGSNVQLGFDAVPPPPGYPAISPSTGQFCTTCPLSACCYYSGARFIVARCLHCRVQKCFYGNSWHELPESCAGFEEFAMSLCEACTGMIEKMTEVEYVEILVERIRREYVFLLSASVTRAYAFSSHEHVRRVFDLKRKRNAIAALQADLGTLGHWALGVIGAEPAFLRRLSWPNKSKRVDQLVWVALRQAVRTS